jgi:hypothetical protein
MPLCLLLMLHSSALLHAMAVADRCVQQQQQQLGPAQVLL